MPHDLLLEIGCEEIPAKMLARQLVELPKLVEERLAGARLAHAGVRSLGTPRRLAVIVKQLADRQPDLNEEVVGPPVSAAFAADGSVTKAGAGFAAKNGVEPSALQKKEVPGKKGQYAVAVRSVVGQDTRGLLPGLLGELAKAIQWAKSQRWNWGETVFVRPVQWLVALYGAEVVPFQWANLTAGRTSRGHRFLSPGTVEIASPDQYVKALHAAHVIVDPEDRTNVVRGELARLERETKLRVRPDETLLGEVIHLGEWPVGVSGEFDRSFLEVPEEVIVTAMRTHQRYFAMEAPDGTLANRFATMMATIVKDPVVVQKGNERVLAARLSDAKFFFAEDKKKSFDAWNEKLASVVFQAKLGDRAKTIGHKVQRIEAIATALAAHVGADPAAVVQAARVCKADLASSAVGEFPELQGVMGRHYAKHFGQPPEIARAIDEHWWPKGQGAQLPQSDLGAILALADRMDTVAGCFAVGLIPSGSADPLGLRRAAIGIWQILLARGESDPRWASAFRVLTDAAVAACETQGVTFKHDLDRDLGTMYRFFRQRLHGLFVEQGIPAQDADAALSQDFMDPIDARARALAIARIPKAAREVFKRVANILDDAKQKQIVPSEAVDPKLFVTDRPVETNLHAAILDAQSRETDARKRRDYPAVFDSLVQLQPIVAAFFDKGGVMVMDPDPKLRDNRLALLNWFITPYMAIADFRLLAGAS
jgi:glycyl-tRNA synthetase beta chain